VTCMDWHKAWLGHTTACEEQSVKAYVERSMKAYVERSMKAFGERSMKAYVEQSMKAYGERSMVEAYRVVGGASFGMASGSG